MSGEETELSIRVSSDLSDWLEELAGEDRDSEAAARDLLAAVRAVEADRTSPTEELSDRLDQQREEYRDLIEDVRDRVIQVKRETDAKAEADHGHPEIVEALGETEKRLSALEEGTEDLQSDFEAVANDLESGFRNYEDVLEYLVDTTDGIREDLDVLADVVVSLRDRTEDLAADGDARAEADRLKRAGNQLGIRAADCEDCGSTVQLGLLATPECPHCKARFQDVEKGSGFFSSNTLRTGDAPAIEGDVGVDEGRLADVVDAETEEAPSTDLSDGGDPE